MTANEQRKWWQNPDGTPHMVTLEQFNRWRVYYETRPIMEERYATQYYRDLMDDPEAVAEADKLMIERSERKEAE